MPRGRVEGASHEVASFSSPYRSVRSYIQNLNRHPTYQLLRDIRLKARNRDDIASGPSLAAGLLGYSERGEDYVEEIRNMIRHNNLNYYDEDFQVIVQESDSRKLSELAAASKEEVLLPGAASDDETSGEG